MKAFSVIAEYEATGGIIFAKHAIVARRLGANEYADGDFSSVSCRRAPWADLYADRALPARLMIAHGWNFKCSDCGERIDEDFLYDKNLSLEGVIGSQHSHVFCSSRCARRHFSIQRRRKSEEQRAIETFKAIVRKRFPNADFVDEPDASGYRAYHHAYVEPSKSGWQWRQVVIAFRFPGMKVGPAHFSMNDNHRYGPTSAEYTCCHGDLEAFQAYVNASKSEASQ